MRFRRLYGHHGLMCAVPSRTCRSAHWSRSGGGGQLVSVEAPAGVQAVWLELLTLPRSFSWWQVAGAGALPGAHGRGAFIHI